MGLGVGITQRIAKQATMDTGGYSMDCRGIAIILDPISAANVQRRGSLRDNYCWRRYVR